MDRRDNASEWRHKGRAIQESANALIAAINASSWKNLEGALIVPAPPSKTKQHPAHDDRVCQIARRIGKALSLDVAELLENKAEREAQSASKARRDIEGLTANLRFTGALSERPRGIFLLDDVLTTGATFVACKSVLQQHLPGIHVVGLFVARRVPRSPEVPEESVDS